MTVLPYVDIKATPIRSVESPRLSRTQSFPRLNGSTGQKPQTSPQTSPRLPHRNRKLSTSSPVRSSIPAARARTPKIKIVARSDEILKRLPQAKTVGAQEQSPIWKPLIRDLPDYDYLWEPVHREDIRHQYDFYTPPQRLIASRPDEPYRMTTMFETVDRHYHNYKRVQAMQQRQWNREHMQYTIYPYSQIEEREMYNKHIRSTLKGQMEQKAQTDKNEHESRQREVLIAMEQDRQALEEDKQRQIDRARFLAQTTVQNKELMQNKWQFDQWNRVHQWHVERAILADDPVNWSKTMT